MSQPETRYARSGDVSVAFQVVGSGPRDLVFVPGVISHVEFFHELPGYSEFLNGLALFSRVIVLDKRGNGLSDRVAGAPSLEERMDDIRAVMDAVGSERATLFAVSEGGPISLLFAATHPARVERLVLYETFACYGGIPGHTFVWEPDAHRQFTEFMVETYGTGASLAGFGGSWGADPQVQALWAKAERLSNSPGGFRAVYEMLFETDVRPALPNVHAPCLVIHAKDESSMFEEQSRYLAEQLSDARLLALDDIDHFPWFSGGDRIVAEVEEFVTGTRSALPSDRVLATVLFTDIVDSTAHAASMGDHRWREVLDRFQTTVRAEIGRHRGREVNTRGDDFLITFDGPARAVRCASAIASAAGTIGLSVRCGIHTGEIELRGDDISGIAVHIGARVSDLAQPGETLATTTVRDLVVGSGICFEERGHHDLKGVPGTWGLVAVADCAHT